MNKYIWKYEKPLAELARLMANGKSDMEEAHVLRDELAEIEYNMCEKTILFVSGLSSDLYMIEDKEILDTPVNSYVDFRASYHLCQWEKCLGMLREDNPFIDNEYRAYYRGIIYHKLGCVFSAREFYKYAIKLNKHIKYYWGYLMCLLACRGINLLKIQLHF